MKNKNDVRTLLVIAICILAVANIIVYINLSMKIDKINEKLDTVGIDELEFDCYYPWHFIYECEWGYGNSLVYWGEVDKNNCTFKDVDKREECDYKVLTRSFGEGY